MRDLTEAELIEMEKRADSLMDTLDHDPEEMRTPMLLDAFDAAFYQAQNVAQDIETLCDHARAVSIEAQKMENLAAKDWDAA